MPRSAGSRHRVRPDRRSPWACPPPAGAAPTFATSPVYRPRRPAETPLYRVVQHHLNTFLAQAEADEIRPVPRWTEREFRQYLTCGILAYGFARARCGDCHQERLIAFSCKGRGVCPSCTNRRMAEVAAHLQDRVIPRVPVRQWVLSVPKRLRPALARDPDLAGAVLRILLRVVDRALRDTAGAPLLPRLGSAPSPSCTASALPSTPIPTSISPSPTGCSPGTRKTA